MFPETIGHDDAKNISKFTQPEEQYWLPRRYNQNTEEYRADDLSPIFVRACKAAGFRLIMSNHVEMSNNRSRILFVCSRYRHHKKKKKQASNATTTNEQTEEKEDGEEEEEVAADVPERERTVAGNLISSSGKLCKTERPIKDEDELCKFSFKVYWDGGKKRWFVPKKQKGNKEHAGHIRKEPHQVRMRRNKSGKKLFKLPLMQ